MPKQTDLELEIAGLLVRSRSMAAIRDRAAVTRVIHELLDCASRAKAAGLAFSEQQLKREATNLELSHPPNPSP